MFRHPLDLIETKALTEAEQKACCLTETQILRLTEIAVHLEKLYGNARDIEWAIYQVILAKQQPQLKCAVIDGIIFLERNLFATISSDNHFEFVLKLGIAA